eukprot:2553137-Amphidinium_carterae.1
MLKHGMPGDWEQGMSYASDKCQVEPWDAFTARCSCGHEETEGVIAEMLSHEKRARRAVHDQHVIVLQREAVCKAKMESTTNCTRTRVRRGIARSRRFTSTTNEWQDRDWGGGLQHLGPATPQQATRAHNRANQRIRKGMSFNPEAIPDDQDPVRFVSMGSVAHVARLVLVVLPVIDEVLVELEMYARPRSRAGRLSPMLLAEPPRGVVSP